MQEKDSSHGPDSPEDVIDVAMPQDQERLAPLRAGGKPAMAKALAQIEAMASASDTVQLLDAAFRDAKGHVLGITGPPGVGKSTLITGLIKTYRSRGETVGVIAIDPSSSRSGGALLGDRVRLDVDPMDQGVFVRSMAARDRIGGLASITTGAMVIMRAVYDRVIVETVGVGQSETDIATIADTVLFCVQPGSGDSLQYMKAGIAEIPDIALVTKADLGAVAKQTKRDLTSALTATGRALGIKEREGWQVPVLEISAIDFGGIETLCQTIDRHLGHLKGNVLKESRHRQAETWVRLGIQEAYGREGVRLSQAYLTSGEPDAKQSPFDCLHQILGRLNRRMQEK